MCPFFGRPGTKKLKNRRYNRIFRLLGSERRKVFSIQIHMCRISESYRYAHRQGGYATKTTDTHSGGIRVSAFASFTDKFGEVVRYRARLVAQGYRQVPFDSYLPDELYSPVVHKDTLRLFLSVCCSRNLRVYHADVKSAFLQAPLTERIFIKAPPGYRTVTPSGEEEILELMQAILAPFTAA